MSRLLWIAMLCLSALGARAESWSVALLGDTPYNDYERRQLPRMFEAMAAEKVNLIVHVGDIKSGRSRCEDALYQDRQALFDSAPAPFVLVPGDNEWSDCARLSNGHYDPQERLQALRRHFHSGPESLGSKPIRLERQKGDYPEQTRFRLGPVLFVTLNVPGNNNNHGPRPGGSAEFRARNSKAMEWLRESFRAAKRAKLRGVVVMMHGNPYFEHYVQGLPHGGYRHLLDQLRDETQRFSGNVLLVHGDTHRQRIDQPLTNRQGILLSNFTRVETSGYPFLGWTQLVINTDNPWLFQFEHHPWNCCGTKSESSTR